MKIFKMFKSQKKDSKQISDDNNLSNSSLPYINANIFNRGMNGYLNYGLYLVSGFDSNDKKVTIKINSTSNEGARQQALGSGIKEHSLEITMTEFKTPTEQQIEYALDLGITIPDRACHEDVSCMINRVTEDDEKSPPVPLAIYADRKGAQFSAWIGEKAFFNMMYIKLEHRDRLAFFAYCVYCYLYSKTVENLDESPDAELFYAFADKFSADASINASLNKLEGAALIEFGTYEGKTGTAAYVVAAKFFLENSKKDNNDN
ncbi:MAG: hypothetical protein FWF15_00890 [Oscillospiraceae bacterium]|nr:hypothetical protein [Oscillospiraceae bacterium]